MSIEGLGIAYNATATSATTATKATEEELGKEEFLTLLVAQLKNQDPLNPLDATDFTAQLAQFSSLEQLIEINNNLGDMQRDLTTQENANILDYIGKAIKADDTTITVSDKVEGSIGYSLDDKVDVNIHIYNDDGIEVRTINAGKQGPGEYALAWDGLTTNGEKVQDGVYGFDVSAVSETGETILCDSYLAGEVTGISYKGSMPFLMIGNREIDPQSVLEVKENSG